MEADITSQAVGLASSADFSLVNLFIRADIVVKSVIIMLIACSIYSWAVIIEKYRLFKKINQSTEEFETKFWNSKSAETFYNNLPANVQDPMALIFKDAMQNLLKRRSRTDLNNRMTTMLETGIEKQISKITEYIGSDVILGLDSTNSILNSKKKIKRYRNCKKLFTLVVKPTFGCSTKEIYSCVKKFDKVKFYNPQKKMFNFNYLKKANNSLEKIASKKYPILIKVKTYLRNLEKPIFVRMSGSGSAFIAYYASKRQCDMAQKQFNKDHKKYWCISSKTI